MVARRRANKMGAVKVGAMVGDQACRFDSKAEYRYALWLEGEKKAGRIDQWVHHPGRDDLHGQDGSVVATMEPDFRVWLANGESETHEVKGMATAAWRIKRALFESEYVEPYVVIDAGWPDEKNGGPRLFDDRRKNKAAKKRARRSK